MSRPRKVTAERVMRLVQVAQIRLKAEAVLATVPVNKRLAHELGVTPGYLHNIMHRLTTIMRVDPRVPHETLRRALFNDSEFRRLMDQLIERDQHKEKVNVITFPFAEETSHSQE